MKFLDLARIAAIAALATSAASRAQSSADPTVATLSVTFTGIEAKQGAVMVALYDEAGWSGGKPVRAEMVAASIDPVSVTIGGLPAGRYGVKAFHDLNGNAKLDANPFGMPTEPFAFSNNAHGATGPATWADAAFAVAAGANAQTITIR